MDHRKTVSADWLNRSNSTCNFEQIHKKKNSTYGHSAVFNKNTYFQVLKRLISRETVFFSGWSRGGPEGGDVLFLEWTAVKRFIVQHNEESQGYIVKKEKKKLNPRLNDM